MVLSDFLSSVRGWSATFPGGNWVWCNSVCCSNITSAARTAVCDSTSFFRQAKNYGPSLFYLFNFYAILTTSHIHLLNRKWSFRYRFKATVWWYKSAFTPSLRIWQNSTILNAPIGYVFIRASLQDALSKSHATSIVFKVSSLECLYFCSFQPSLQSKGWWMGRKFEILGERYFFLISSQSTIPK